MINIAAAEIDNNLKPKLSVLGIGGAGGNAVNNMVESGLEGVDFLVANTDAQDLSTSKAQIKIQLGINLTKGLGAGADPLVGRGAAEESLNEIIESLSDSNMVFITAGMGGGTGSGACAVIGQALRERGVLTVGVVTKPFDFEGKQRARIADAAIEDLKSSVDTLIIIPNQNLFNVIDKNTSFDDAFHLTDNVLHDGVSSITDLIVKQGRMNKDFADIKAIVGKMGEAMMGTGEAEGENRAIEAAEEAIANPLLDNVSMKGAKGVLLNITGSKGITLFEVDAVTNRIRAEIDADDEAEFIIGTTIDESMGDVLKVSIVATGLTTHGSTPVRHAVKPKVQRPFMDDGAVDITDIKFDAPEAKEELVQQQSIAIDEVAAEKAEEVTIPVSLFAAGMEDEVPNQVFEELESDEDIPTVSENIVKISENGEIIRPVSAPVAPIEPKVVEPIVAVAPVAEKAVAEEKSGFLSRLMKKEKVDEIVEEPVVKEKQENFEDIQLPDFLQR